MIEPKPEVKNLYRTKMAAVSREGFLRLDLNEAVPGLPEEFVRDAISGIRAETLASYPEYVVLQNKLAEGFGLLPENIGLGSGSDGIIKNIYEAYVGAGHTVLMTDPTFAMYPVYAEMVGSRKKIVDYLPDFSFPFEQFRAELVPGLRLAVIVNPNNPTGSVLPPAKIEELIRVARGNDTLVVVDEAYFYFYPETVIGLVREYENLIVLRTFSKICGLAAARVGYAAATRDIIENLRRVRPTFDINGIGIYLACKILENTSLLPRMRAEMLAGKDFLVSKLQKAGVDYHEGQGNFVLIKCGAKSEQVREKLTERKILVSAGFKQQYLKDYVRVTIGAPQVMAKFWEEFERIWKCL